MIRMAGTSVRQRVHTLLLSHRCPRLGGRLCSFRSPPWGRPLEPSRFPAAKWPPFLPRLFCPPSRRSRFPVDALPPGRRCSARSLAWRFSCRSSSHGAGPALGRIRQLGVCRRSDRCARPFSGLPSPVRAFPVASTGAVPAGAPYRGANGPTSTPASLSAGQCRCSTYRWIGCREWGRNPAPAPAVGPSCLRYSASSTASSQGAARVGGHQIGHEILLFAHALSLSSLVLFLEPFIDLNMTACPCSPAHARTQCSGATLSWPLM